MVEIQHRVLARLAAAALEHLDLPDDAVFQHCHVLKKVEALEYHAHVRAVFRRVHAAPDDVFPVIEYLAGGRRFKEVDTAQKRRLAGAGRADDADNVALFYGEVNVAQDLMRAEGLGEMVYLQYFLAHGHLSPLVEEFRVRLSACSSNSVLRSSKGVPRSGWLYVPAAMMS